MKIAAFVFCFLLFYGCLHAQKSKAAGDSLSPLNHYSIGKVLVTQKKLEKAIIHFTKATQTAPDMGAAWYELGWCYNETGKHKEAINALMEAKKTLVNEAKVYYELGFAFQQQNEMDYAYLYYQKSVTIKKDFSPSYKKMAEIQFEKNNFKQALVHFNEFRKIVGDSVLDVDYFFKSGFCKNQINEFAAAIDDFKKALQLNPLYLSAKNEMAIAYANRRNANEAIKLFKEVLLQDSTNYDALYGLAEVNKTVLHNCGEAIEFYNKAMKNKPGDKYLLYKIGWCYNDKKQFSQAIEYLLKATEKIKSFDEAFNELGFAYFNLNKFDDAINGYKKINKVHEKALPLYYMAMCYVKLKNKNQAQKLYNDLTALDEKLAEQLLQKINEIK